LRYCVGALERASGTRCERNAFGCWSQQPRSNLSCAQRARPRSADSHQLHIASGFQQGNCNVRLFARQCAHASAEWVEAAEPSIPRSIACSRCCCCCCCPEICKRVHLSGGLTGHLRWCGAYVSVRVRDNDACVQRRCPAGCMLCAQLLLDSQV